MMKINKLEIENVKRVKAVKLEPSASGLTIIGGNNNQGKTSVLDSIAWALGGKSFQPSNPQREGSVLPPYLHITMSNGLVVERKGKNADLKVTDPSGKKAGQQLLDTFVEKLAINLPKFMEASDAEKARTLLSIVGVEDKLRDLEAKEKELYNERLAIGRIADQKKKFADEQEYFPEAPKDLVSASDLIKRQQDILARNAQREQWIKEHEHWAVEAERLKEVIKKMHKELQEVNKKVEVSEKSQADLQMESTEELEKNLQEIDEINRKVRANLDKDKAEEDAREYAGQYDHLTAQIEDVRKAKKSLLDDADLPLPGLTVNDGKLLYRGQQWDNMSGSDQLKVSTAIIRKLNPECGFVLMDKLEQMDLDTLKEFGAWLEQEDLQVIATRVSTGEECSIIITDGYGDNSKPAPEPTKTWSAGTF